MKAEPGLWASLDMNCYAGGRSTIDGVELENLQRNSRLGATIVYPFGGGHAIKAGYSAGALAGLDKTFQIFQISYPRLRQESDGLLARIFHEFVR
jgi:hypothetical protein